MIIPIVKMHCGVHVVRDDLYMGGTKSRIYEFLYAQHQEVVYACAATSKTPVYLAATASRLGKKATAFVAARATPTPEVIKARELGADVHEIRPGYLSVVRARAQAYVDELGRRGAYLAPLGFDAPHIRAWLGALATQVQFNPDEVWCVAGSGMLTRSLQIAWPKAVHHALQVGKHCDVGIAMRHISDLKLEQEFKGETEFPSERHYDAKAWDLCKRLHTRNSKVLFWNVLGDEL